MTNFENLDEKMVIHFEFLWAFSPFGNSEVGNFT
jgi:hypothetical protein